MNQAAAAGALHAGQLHIKGLVKEYRAGTPVLRGSLGLVADGAAARLAAMAVPRALAASAASR